MALKKLIIIIILSVLVVFSFCTQKHSEEESDIILAAASILPLADFTRQVGGDVVRVEVLVPPGSSPHTYEPDLAQLELLSRAELLVLNGIGLEFWADKVIESADNPDMKVVYTAEGLEIFDTRHDEDEEEQEHGEHVHVSGNPHVWLDPVNAIHQVEKICEALIQVEPDSENYFKANKEEYINELKVLHEEIEKQTQLFSNKKVITFHAGFDYFIKRYGFEKVAVIEESPGREPTPSKVADIVELTKQHGVNVLFAEPQFPVKVAEVIAEECDARVAFLDPLGKEGDYSYIDLMRSNLRQLEKYLK